jgi:tetratricopeptide (TPR) repeat protein
MLTRALLHDDTASTLERAELHGILSARAALASLREEALAAARQEVALYRELAEDDPAEHYPALADALGDLGLRLIALGRTEDAVPVSEEAVALCRVVAAEDDDWAPQLAGALDRLSLRYAALGRRYEASAAIAEACALYRAAAARNPALFGHDLARAAHHQTLVSQW